jgi:hypothetical protein
MTKKDDQAALYLGLRQLEWLFLTCHNSWIVFHLTKIGNETVLAYSPMLDIVDSSVPFRAYFGSVLSVLKQVPVKPTVLPADLVLDTLQEEDDDDDGESGDSSSDGDHGDNKPSPAAG